MEELEKENKRLHDMIYLYIKMVRMDTDQKGVYQDELRDITPCVKDIKLLCEMILSTIKKI